MRQLATPFVVAPPAGARVRTRLRVDAADEHVLWAVGEHLGRLGGRDQATRCRLGRGDDQRTDRKRALTPQSSSRWAGAITRTSNDQWERAHRNLGDARAGLRRATKKIRARLAVPVGQARGRDHSRVQGYHSQAERFQKQRRLQHLQARLAEVEARIAQSRVSVCRGGRRIAKLRHALDRADVPLTPVEWRARWEAERLFLTADGEADKAWGNETIRVHPDERWLELRLPSPLAHLSNTPGRAATYRLGCPVAFTYRASEWAAQAASGAVRYDLFLDPARGRWYADARQAGRETLGRGSRGRRVRRTVAGIPTRAFRELLVGMAANAELWVIAVDPGWTSKWGQSYWKDPLNHSTSQAVTVTGHHAAAVVIGRRGLGFGARRRPGVTGLHRRMGNGALPARPGNHAVGREGPAPPGGQWAAAPPRKTRQAERIGLGDQVAHDRSVPPVSATDPDVSRTVS